MANLNYNINLSYMLARHHHARLICLLFVASFYITDLQHKEPFDFRLDKIHLKLSASHKFDDSDRRYVISKLSSQRRLDRVVAIAILSIAQKQGLYQKIKLTNLLEEELKRSDSFEKTQDLNWGYERYYCAGPFDRKGMDALDELHLERARIDRVGQTELGYIARCLSNSDPYYQICASSIMLSKKNLPKVDAIRIQSTIRQKARLGQPLAGYWRRAASIFAFRNSASKLGRR